MFENPFAGALSVLKSTDRVLPAYVEHFSSLRTLDLSDNYLTGQVSCEISQLTNLTSLDLSDNS
jgi:Leucine-rich repeat (LRR) protein